jgi:hypothetical protein
MKTCLRAFSHPVEPFLREFMFDYVEVDPQFHRSGYLMERVLRRIKKLSLTPEEAAKLQLLLLNRIRVKALRNF